MKLQKSVEIYSFRVLRADGDAQGSGWFQVIAAIQLAYLKGCRVLNLSLRAPEDASSLRVFGPYGPFRTVIRELHEQSHRNNESPAVFCCAVGNEGNHHPPVWPARLALPMLIPVAAATPPVGQPTYHIVPGIAEVIPVGAHDADLDAYEWNHAGARVLGFGVGVRSYFQRRWASLSGSSQATAFLTAFHAFFDHNNVIVNMPHPATPVPLVHALANAPAPVPPLVLVPLMHALAPAPAAALAQDGDSEN